MRTLICSPFIRQIPLTITGELTMQQKGINHRTLILDWKKVIEERIFLVPLWN